MRRREFIAGLNLGSAGGVADWGAVGLLLAARGRDAYSGRDGSHRATPATGSMRMMRQRVAVAEADMGNEGQVMPG
jgi:hypothetical protein